MSNRVKWFQPVAREAAEIIPISRDPCGYCQTCWLVDDHLRISLRGSEPDHKPPGLLPPRPGKSISAGIGEGFIEFDCRIWIPKWRIGARTFKDTRPEFRTFVIVPMY